ncbi:MAG: 16S rRNA (cytidine(1402)-2'-O)-methyltransferase [Burkholderiaceae bacterium]|nr:MAG: 16S rRNA (cytidine(1402)-2'-O)-methyltransferase [Burkholderiaceae bacterium]
MHSNNLTDSQFPPGTLYVVATPIGNLDDITLRALACLKIVDCIAAEDTRHSRSLLQHYGIATPLLAVHEHNEREAATGLIARLQAGERIALITDAGTPAISDPGARLVDAVRSAGLPVIPLPGACAAIAALSVSGLLGSSFHFEGFLPGKTGARQERLEQLALLPSQVVLYEAPHRIVDTLHELAQAFGDSRQILIARELTKRFEQTVRLPLAQACAWIEASPDHQRGEFVLVLAAAEALMPDALSAEAARLMDLLLPELPPKRAAAIAAAATGSNKKALYDYGLQAKAKP